MKDKKLLFNRSCHVLYSRPCKKEIRAKIAPHYPATERETVWEKVQRQYAEFLSDWRTDLGGKRNFHNGVGGTYDCIAIMSYYTVCKAVTSFRETEEMEENLKPISLFIMNLHRVRQRSLPPGTVLQTSCLPCAMWTMHPWNCSTQGWCGRLPAWTAVGATIPSAATKTHT